MNFVAGSFDVQTMVGILTTVPTEEELNITEFREFYNGFQKVRLSDRQKEYLKCDSNMRNAFVNVSKMVPNILLDRLAIKPEGRGLIAEDEESRDYADAASGWWVQGGLDKFSSDLHKLILRDGSAALFVEWFDGMPLFTPKPIWTDQTVEGVRFHAESNAVDVAFDFASYQWPVDVFTIDGEVIQDTLIRMNLYTRPDTEGGGSLIFRFKSEDGDQFQPLTDEEIFNELGIAASNPQELDIPFIPIVKFVNTDQLSEIADIFRLQQLINKSVGDIDISSDFHSFPTITADEFPNAENQQIQPGMILRAKGARRIEPANLELMWKGTVLNYVDMISLVKRWPMWLLNPRDFTVPSGTALRVAERPLVSQIREKQNSLSPQWRLALDSGRAWAEAMTTDILTGEINIQWQSASTDNVIEDNKLVVETSKLAGLPDEEIWRRVFGFNTAQIETIDKQMLDDPDFREQQSRIILNLSQALVDIGAAAEFAGVSEEDAIALATFGNAEDEDRQAAINASNGAGAGLRVNVDGGS